MTIPLTNNVMAYVSYYRLLQIDWHTMFAIMKTWENSFFDISLCTAWLMKIHVYIREKNWKLKKKRKLNAPALRTKNLRVREVRQFTPPSSCSNAYNCACTPHFSSLQFHIESGLEETERWASCRKSQTPSTHDLIWFASIRFHHPSQNPFWWQTIKWPMGWLE